MAHATNEKFNLQGVLKEKDQSSPYKEFSKTFGGKIVYDYNDINVTTIGIIRLKGEVPRILPRKRINPISATKFDYLGKKLRTWKNQYWQDYGKKWEELIYVAAIHGYTTGSPFFAIGSVPMSLLMRLTLWILATDDLLDTAMKDGLIPAEVDEPVDQLIKISEGDKVLVPSPGKFPEFHSCFGALSNIFDDITKLVPQYRTICSAFVASFQMFMDASVWHSKAILDKRYSDGSYVYWRRRNSFWTGTVEFIFVLLGLNLSNKIRYSSTFGRITDITDSMGGYTSDLLAVQKGLTATNNKVLFQIIQKKIPVVKLVRDTAELMNEEMRDLLLLRNVLFERYPNNPSLTLFLDIVETVIDGFAIVYANSKRHLGQRFITMTWNAPASQEGPNSTLSKSQPN